MEAMQNEYTFVDKTVCLASFDFVHTSIVQRKKKVGSVTGGCSRKENRADSCFYFYVLVHPFVFRFLYQVDAFFLASLKSKTMHSFACLAPRGALIAEKNLKKDEKGKRERGDGFHLSPKQHLKGAVHCKTCALKRDTLTRRV